YRRSGRRSRGGAGAAGGLARAACRGAGRASAAVRRGGSAAGGRGARGGRAAGPARNRDRAGRGLEGELGAVAEGDTARTLFCVFSLRTSFRPPPARPNRGFARPLRCSVSRPIAV